MGYLVHYLMIQYNVIRYEHFLIERRPKLIFFQSLHQFLCPVSSWNGIMLSYQRRFLTKTRSGQIAWSTRQLSIKYISAWCRFKFDHLLVPILGHLYMNHGHIDNIKLDGSFGSCKIKLHAYFTTITASVPKILNWLWFKRQLLYI